MKTYPKILEDPEAYGSKGQTWHPSFVAYMVEILTHPVYARMPDAVNDDGKIQWEAPSNRGSGKFQHTHHRRRDWWHQKALSIGVDPTSDKWISTVAKRIHPTGSKPCKRCGQIMRIAYVYPNDRMKSRLLKAFGTRFEFDAHEPVTDLVQRIELQYGQSRLSQLRGILKTGRVMPPEDLTDAEQWISWLENDYISTEPSLLSPGVMSNAPDRFDGFHSFNRCCRKTADTGRHDNNMRTYSTDRRVFEYWSDGDWIAADRMMGIISSRMRSEPCKDAGEGSPTADHIGPLSLGFAHRPHFRLLSRSANSAKNNRMTLEDVIDLIQEESTGGEVVSWYAKPLWNLKKNDVLTEELALRLSKVLRDNQRAAMHLLVELYEGGHATFLATLLGLERANFNIEFVNLRVRKFVPVFDEINYAPRTTKYAAEQKARRLRIGFEALRAYREKENRHGAASLSHVMSSVEPYTLAARDALSKAGNEVRRLDEEIAAALADPDALLRDQKLRTISTKVPILSKVDLFLEAKAHLQNGMAQVAHQLSQCWESDRYVRSTFEQIDQE